METPRVIAIIPAAGTGSRIGLSRSKVLLPVGPLTILQKTVRALEHSGLIDEFVIAVRNEDLREIKEADFGDAVIHFVVGGKERQDSVRNAVEFIDQKLEKPDYVLVHDAARCLVSADLIRRCVVEAMKVKAVTAAVRSIDSVIEAGEDGTVIRHLNRAHVWMVQTPQVFTFELIKKAHAESTPGATDDASLVEPFHTISLVEGERSNIKVTTREDYESLLEKITEDLAL